MCECVTHCRIWEETQGGKYPPSDHAPSCPEFKQEEFTIVEYDGARCVMEPREAKVMLEENPDEEYTASTVMLTRDQYEKMPEFQGF